MSLDLLHVQVAHQEYERRIQAHLLERAALKARSARSEAIAQRIRQAFRLAVSLITATWRWGRNTRQPIDWSQPAPSKTL